MASVLRYDLPLDPLSLRFAAVPRHGAYIESCVYLESQEPGHPVELLGTDGLFGPISTLGFDDV